MCGRINIEYPGDPAKKGDCVPIIPLFKPQKQSTRVTNNIAVSLALRRLQKDILGDNCSKNEPHCPNPPSLASSPPLPKHRSKTADNGKETTS